MARFDRRRCFFSSADCMIDGLCDDDVEMEAEMSDLLSAEPLSCPD